MLFTFSGCVTTDSHNDPAYQTSLPLMEFPIKSKLLTSPTASLREQGASYRRFSAYTPTPYISSSSSSPHLLKVSLTSPGMQRTPPYNTKQFVSRLDYHVHHYHHLSEHQTPPAPHLASNNDTSQTYLGEMAAIDCTLYNPEEHSVSSKFCMKIC